MSPPPATVRPSRRGFLRGTIAGMAAAAVTRCRGGRGDPRPSIVLIVADDLGIDGVGCYGGTSFRTPHVDRLAQEGLRFENVYATPLCTPSRVELLTGRYPFRTGFTANMQRIEEDAGFSVALDPDREVTFARLLRDQGYRTAVAGKWQLARFDLRPDHVRECGFDTYRCWLWRTGASYTSRYWLPSVLEDGVIHRAIPGVYGPDLYAGHVAEFIRSHGDRPFLAVYAMALPHGPYEPTPRQVDPAAVHTVPAPAAENFGPMVSYLDELVGRVVRAVDDAGIAERTLVLFTADNGTPPDVEVTFRGVTQPGGKARASEAGMRVPLIARWPGTVPAGRVTEDLVDLSDLLPTFAELAGAPLPAGRVIDGRSFVPLLRGSGPGARDWIFSQVRDRHCVRTDRFKLYSDGRLFDLAADPFERENIIRHPGVRDVYRSLQALLDRITREPAARGG